MHTKVDANSNDLNRSRFSLRNRLDRFQTRLDGFSVCIRAFTFTFNLSAEALRQICRLSFVLPSTCIFFFKVLGTYFRLYIFRCNIGAVYTSWLWFYRQCIYIYIILMLVKFQSLTLSVANTKWFDLIWIYIPC